MFIITIFEKLYYIFYEQGTANYYKQHLFKLIYTTIFYSHEQFF